MKRPACLFLLGLLLAVPASAQVSNFQLRMRAILRSRAERSVTDTLGRAYYLVVPARLGEGGEKLPPAARAFSAVAGAYTDLKVPNPQRDSANLIVGNDNFSLRGELGGKSLAVYLECGSDVNGVYAEIYPINTSLITLVTPLPADSVEVRTLLFATAVNIPKPIPTRECKSTGELEKKIYQSMLKRLAR